MPLPTIWTRVPITGTFTDRAGNACVGRVTFSSRQVVVIDGVVVVPKSIATPLVNGSIPAGFTLPATNDPDLNLTGWAYTVKEAFPSGRDEYAIFVEHDAVSIDRTGVAINEEVSAMGVFGQAVGFSPSETRNAQEGRSAIYSMDRQIEERRRSLLQQYSSAAIVNDRDGMQDAREAIARFNEKQPARRIKPAALLNSVRNKRKRMVEAEQGIYLPKARRGAMESGNFAIEDPA